MEKSWSQKGGGESGYPFDSWKVERTKNRNPKKQKIIIQLTLMRKNWECSNIQPKAPRPAPPRPTPQKLPAHTKSLGFRIWIKF